MSNFIERLLLRKKRNILENIEINDDSFEQMVKKSTMSSDEKKMFINLFDIKDALVEDIMVPRSEVVALNENADFFAVIDAFSGKNYKQILVYKKNFDNIIGYIMLKDVIEYAKNPKSFSIRKVLKEVSFIAPSLKCFETLCYMQQVCKTFFVIVDEFGGVDGVVSIENIVSKLFGDIKDYSFEKISYVDKQEDGSYIVDARISIVDFESKVGVNLMTEDELDELDVDTIGGFVVSIKGELPEIGEKISYQKGNVIFKVIDVDPRKINKLEVWINQKQHDSIVNEN